MNTNLYYILTHAGGGLGYCHTWLLFMHTQDTTWQKTVLKSMLISFVALPTYFVSQNLCQYFTPSRWGTNTLINHRTGAAWGGNKIKLQDGRSGKNCVLSNNSTYTMLGPILSNPSHLWLSLGKQLRSVVMVKRSITFAGEVIRFTTPFLGENP